MAQVRVSRRLLIVLGATVAAILALAGAAVAAWQSSGSGSATVSALNAQASVISTVTADKLYPGASQTATISVSNPNPYPVIVTSISSGSSGAQGNCTAGTVTSDAVNGSPAVVQADGSTTTIPAAGSGTYQLTTHMVGGADNSCQGLSFSLALTAGLQSAAG